MVGPVHELLNDGHEGFAAFGEGVLHPGWHFGIDGADYKPVSFQTAQGLREHLLRAIGIGGSNVAESQWALIFVECVERCKRPFVPNAGQHIADGALRENGVLDEVFFHRAYSCLMVVLMSSVNEMKCGRSSM